MFVFAGDFFSMVGGLFAFCCVAVAMVGVAIAFVGQVLAVVGDSFTLVGFPVALVVDALPFVGVPFALVGNVVAFVGFAVALVGEVVAFFRGAHPLGPFDESQFLQPTAGLGRESAKVSGPAPFLGVMFTFVRGTPSFVCRAKPARGCFTSTRREKLASLRRSPAQPRGEHTCLSGSLPELQGDSLQPGDLAGFVLPTFCGGHAVDCTPLRGPSDRSDLRSLVDLPGAPRATNRLRFRSGISRMA
ncbi:hypothetical protein [Actinopolymorpha cephalotaxi]|uniref:Uncharacterized protein n=1 Tax=Actinopolymorpha cephalotaxi TaxID=504797 RepID=A0ABX2S9Q0_9ACTN|nr:hypothetical protein [Actinopolymorpha cephalotaxi]NYH86051.1 hypothetical protein [Actinopolymorpha cephalotaxi]